MVDEPCDKVQQLLAYMTWQSHTHTHRGTVVRLRCLSQKLYWISQIWSMTASSVFGTHADTQILLYFWGPWIFLVTSNYCDFFPVSTKLLSGISETWCLLENRIIFPNILVLFWKLGLFYFSQKTRTTRVKLLYPLMSVLNLFVSFLWDKKKATSHGSWPLLPELGSSC